MSNLNFAVEFKSDVIIKMATCEIRQITIGGESIGYIAINGDVITPFTAFGEIQEVDCVTCAAKTLFAIRSGVHSENIDIAKAERKREPFIEKLMISALMQAALKN